MPKTPVDTQRLAKKTAGGPHVSLRDVQDRLVEKIEHHCLSYTLDVDGKCYKLCVAFFDVAKPTDIDGTHDRSATLNLKYIDEIPTLIERDAIKLFITHHLKLAQAVTVYDTSTEVQKNKDDCTCRRYNPKAKL
jgi:hypothetical protein